jgi:CBS domain-containing protein
MRTLSGPSVQVRAIMAPPPPAVSVRATAVEARRLLQALDLPQLFVVDRDGVLIGVLGRQALGSRDDLPCERLMRRAPPAVDDDDDLVEAIALMLTNGVSSLPAVGPRFELVGLVHYADAVRYLDGPARGPERRPSA